MMDHDEYLEWVGLVEDTLISTYTSIKGNTPDQGGFRPNEETVATLVSIYQGNRQQIIDHCQDALCVHIYSASVSKSFAPFFVNSRLLSKDMMEALDKKRHLIKARFKSTLSAPTNYYTEIYRSVAETEIEYLTYRSTFHFRGIDEFDWSLIQPSLYWYILVVEGIKGMPTNRLKSKDDIPAYWEQLPIDYDQSCIELLGAVAKERRKMAKAEVRTIFVQAAEKALYETARQWCENNRLMRLYLDKNKRVAISPEFSKLRGTDIEVTWPLETRDNLLFDKAKELMLERGETFPDFSVYEDPDVDFSYERKGDFEAGKNSSRGTMVLERKGTLESALSSLNQNPDE